MEKIPERGRKRLRSYLKIQFVLGPGVRNWREEAGKEDLVSLKDHWWGWVVLVLGLVQILKNAFVVKATVDLTQQWPSQLCSPVQGCLLHRFVLGHTPQPALRTWAPPCCGQLKLRSVCLSFSKIHIKFTIVNILWCIAQWYYLHIFI